MSTTISIPCLSHQSCNFHQTISPSVHATCACQDSHHDHGKDTTVAETRPGRLCLEKLPAELLLIIIDDLEPVAKACLALTSHSMASVIGTTFWRERRTKMRRDEMNVEINEFLNLLMRDVGNRYWHCAEYAILHQRSFIEPQPIGLKLGYRHLKGLLSSQQRNDESFHVRVQGKPIYTLTFPTAEAMTDRLHMGPKICTDTLSCKAVYKYSYPYPILYMVLKVEYEPRIVLDRLLLKATYIWEVDDWKNKLAIISKNETEPRQWTQHSIKKIDLWVCEHLEATEMIEKVFARPLSREKLRCQYCPTEYWISNCIGSRVQYSAKIEVWHNFGPCRNREEVRWTHMVSSGEEKKEYEWAKVSKRQEGQADEEVWDAYEWINCRTRKAFEKKHGRFGVVPWSRNFYPDLSSADAYRSCKTLPRSVAETL